MTNCKALGCLIATTALAATALAQKQSMKISPELRELIDQAGASRIEIAADLGFAILDRGKVPLVLKEEYLEKLATRASEARRPFPLMAAPTVGQPDFRTGFLQSLSFFNLDGLSINLRAIRRMAVSNTRLAQRLAQGLRYQLPSGDVGCEDTEVPTLGFVYYESLLPLIPDEYPYLVGYLPTLQHVSSLVGALTQEHDLTVVLGRPSLANYSAEQRRVAILSLISALGTVRASYRVFSTMELGPDLSLGGRVESLLRSGNVPVGLDAALAKAYIGFLERHLRIERCVDGPASSDGDPVQTATVVRALELAKRYGVTAFNPKDIVPKYSDHKPEPTVANTEGEWQKRDLQALAWKLKQIGSGELKDRFATAAEAYARHGLAKSDAAFDAADRCLTLLGLALSPPDPALAARLFELALGLLEKPELKDNEPVAWITLVRVALNEVNGPNARLAAEASRFFRQTRNRDLALYFKAQQTIGVISGYQKAPLHSFEGIVGRY